MTLMQTQFTIQCQVAGATQEVVSSPTPFLAATSLPRDVGDNLISNFQNHRVRRTRWVSPLDGAPTKQIAVKSAKEILNA